MSNSPSSRKTPNAYIVNMTSKKDLECNPRARGETSSVIAFSLIEALQTLREECPDQIVNGIKRTAHYGEIIQREIDEKFTS